MRTPTDPEAAKLRSKQLDFFLICLLLLLVAGIVFQFFLRYAYVHTSGTTVVRVDRVSGDSCQLPCDESGYGPRTVPYVPAPTPVPAKVCHPANVVRVARELVPPPLRTMTPYIEGGPHTVVSVPAAAAIATATPEATEPLEAANPLTPAKPLSPAKPLTTGKSLAAAKPVTPAKPLKHHAHRHGRVLDNAVELSDGHVYVFSRDVFAADVTTWTTGQDVQVCSTLSRLENRPYYSVGASEDAEPANLAL